MLRMSASASGLGGGPRDRFFQKLVGAGKRVVHIVVELEPTIGEHGAAIAILPDRAAVMRHQDNVGTLHTVAESGGAFLPEPLVADLGYLVDQISLELDGEAGAKREPRAHTRGVGVDGHPEIAAQLSEFLDIAGRMPHARAVPPGDKRDVLPA